MIEAQQEEKVRLFPRFPRQGELGERARKKRHALKQQWRALHAEQEPAEPRYLPRWSAALVAPIVLLCAGCIGSAVASGPALLVVLLACLSVIGLAKIGEELGETKSRWWVVYQKCPTWKIGEDGRLAWARRKLGADLPDSERYPGDYTGRIESVIPAERPRPGWAAGELHNALVLDLTPSEHAAASSRKVKVSAGVLVPVTFTDSEGAIAASLIAQFGAARAAALVDAVPDPMADQAAAEEVRSFQAARASLVKALPVTIEVHTGTGLYNTKVVPTHVDDTQSGAPAGQVVTLVTGGLGVDAFKGGYCTNATRTETRSIVSNTAGTITLEGSLATWLDTDDLDIYDAWGTVQASADRLVVDQGGANFSSTQTVAIYTGTYTESVTVSAVLTPMKRCPLKIQPAVGASVGLTNNGLGVVTTLDTSGVECVILSDLDISNVAGPWAISCSAIGCEYYRITGTCLGWIYYPLHAYFEDCAISGTGIGSQILRYPSDCVCVRCSFSLGFVWGYYNYVCSFYGCVFDRVYYFWYSGVQTYPISSIPHTWVNCTFFNTTTFLYDGSAADFLGVRVLLRDCLFHTCTQVLGVHSPAHVDSDHNCFYSCGQVALVNGVGKTFAEWQTWTDESGLSPDVHSFTSVSDPLTNPAAGDFSLQAGSPCRHRGSGAGVVTGINAVAFDPFHPDIGAYATGIGPNRASSG